MRAYALHVFALLILCVAMTACTKTQQPTIKNPRDAIAVAYTTLTTTAQAVSIAKSAGEVSQDEAVLLQAKLQDVKNDVDQARASLMLYENTGIEDTGNDVNDRLARALAALTAIKSFLEGR